MSEHVMPQREENGLESARTLVRRGGVSVERSRRALAGAGFGSLLALIAGIIATAGLHLRWWAPGFLSPFVGNLLGSLIVLLGSGAQVYRLRRRLSQQIRELPP